MGIRVYKLSSRTLVAVLVLGMRLGCVMFVVRTGKDPTSLFKMSDATPFLPSIGNQAMVDLPEEQRRQQIQEPMASPTQGRHVLLQTKQLDGQGLVSSVIALLVEWTYTYGRQHGTTLWMGGSYACGV